MLNQFDYIQIPSTLVSWREEPRATFNDAFSDLDSRQHRLFGSALSRADALTVGGKLAQAGSSFVHLEWALRHNFRTNPGNFHAISAGAIADILSMNSTPQGECYWRCVEYGVYSIQLLLIAAGADLDVIEQLMVQPQMVQKISVQMTQCGGESTDSAAVLQETNNLLDELLLFHLNDREVLTYLVTVKNNVNKVLPVIATPQNSVGYVPGAMTGGLSPYTNSSVQPLVPHPSPVASPVSGGPSFLSMTSGIPIRKLGTLPDVDLDFTTTEKCQHEYVNVGFMSIKMACKHCGADQ